MSTRRGDTVTSGSDWTGIPGRPSITHHSGYGHLGYLEHRYKLPVQRPPGTDSSTRWRETCADSLLSDSAAPLAGMARIGTLS